MLKLNKLKSKLLFIKNLKTIKNSGLFDNDYYLENYPDVKLTGINPLKHFCRHGWKEGRNPSKEFDSIYYIKLYPDVASSNINPLLHYVLHGAKEGRNTTRGNNIDSNKEIKTIRESGLFDADYYLRTNPDVQSAGINPIEHYYFHGWKEGRNPSAKFTTNYYLEAYQDIQLLGTNPLLHYIRFGQYEGRLAKAFEFDEQEYFERADISNTEISDKKEIKLKIAVVFHLYNFDLADEFIYYFKNIPVQYDLYISTTSIDIGKIKNLFSSKLPDIKTVVVNLENRGRDIGPFLFILSEYLQKYELVCKVHTKASNHDINLVGWRQYLLDNLLGNSLIINKIINEFTRNSQLGIVWPVTYPYLSFLGIDKSWGSSMSFQQNFSYAKKYFPEIELGNSDEDISFPNGSMFWFRPGALNLLNKKGIKISNFEEENQQIDGTLAHTIERLFGKITKHSGHEAKTVFFSKKTINNVENQYHKLTHSKSILFVAHDLFRAGAEILLLSLIQWMKKHTALNMYVLAIKPGNDGAKLLKEYEKVSQVFMWNEYCEKYSEKDAMLEIKSETGNIDLIYGNTIIAANIYPLLTVFDAPFITHLHELEESIQRYTTKEMREKWKQHSSQYIACSKPVEENLIASHDISKKNIKCVNAFIRPVIADLPDQINQRIINDLPKEKTIVWGCGTIYWRKGTDIFIEAAKQLKERGLDDFVFCWIGGNYWDLDSNELGTWKEWEGFIEEHGLTDKIVFLGEKENPRDYFTSGDIFFLPSREDPFPLVCLEAAECGLPIVCFEDAGGIPGFVEKDAGIAIPFLNIEAAADALEKLITNKNVRVEKGRTARTKLLQRHSVNIAAPGILQICNSVMKSNPLVSVIVPVYNHARFLNERIDSILNQSFRDYEIIILDDASTDNSLEIAKSYEWHPAIKVVRNKANSGSPFLQWQKGINLAKGKYIWMAEGDDMAKNNFLETLLPAFNDDEVKIAYCASNRIDETGEVFQKHYLYAGHYNNLNYPKSRWENNYINDGLDEVKNTLAIRNTLPNASATLIQTRAIKNIDFDSCIKYKTAGDWFAYLSILNSGKISYNASHLNYHRVHSTSVVAQNKLGPENTIPDYFEIHKFVIQNFSINNEVVDLMIDSITNNLRNIWPKLDDAEFLAYYDPDKLKAEFVKNEKANPAEQEQ